MKKILFYKKSIAFVWQEDDARNRTPASAAEAKHKITSLLSCTFSNGVDKTHQRKD